MLPVTKRSLRDGSGKGQLQGACQKDPKNQQCGSSVAKLSVILSSWRQFLDTNNSLFALTLAIYVEGYSHLVEATTHMVGKRAVRILLECILVHRCI